MAASPGGQFTYQGVEVQYVTCGAQHTMALSHSGVSTSLVFKKSF